MNLSPNTIDQIVTTPPRESPSWLDRFERMDAELSIITDKLKKVKAVRDIDCELDEDHGEHKHRWSIHIETEGDDPASELAGALVRMLKAIQ